MSADYVNFMCILPSVENGYGSDGSIHYAMRHTWSRIKTILYRDYPKGQHYKRDYNEGVGYIMSRGHVTCHTHV